MISTVLAALIWLTVLCVLASISPVLAIFPALYLFTYLD